MAAGIYSLTGSRVIERGADYSFTMDVNTSTGEYPLSGKLVSGYIYRNWDRSLEKNWTAEILSEASGIVQFSLLGSQTSQLSLDPMFHEIFIFDTGNSTATKVLEGEIMVVGGGLP